MNKLLIIICIFLLALPFVNAQKVLLDYGYMNATEYWRDGAGTLWGSTDGVVSSENLKKIDGWGNTSCGSECRISSFQNFSNNLNTSNQPMNFSRNWSINFGFMKEQENVGPMMSLLSQRITPTSNYGFSFSCDWGSPNTRCFISSNGSNNIWGNLNIGVTTGMLNFTIWYNKDGNNAFRVWNDQTEILGSWKNFTTDLGNGQFYYLASAIYEGSVASPKSGFNWTTFTDYTLSEPIPDFSNVYLVSPANNSISNLNYQNFSYNVTPYNQTKCSLYSNITGEWSFTNITGLVAYYPFDLNATYQNTSESYTYDVVSDRQAKVVNATWSGIVNNTGGYNFSPSFNKSYIDLSNSIIFNFINNESFTLNLWFYTNNGNLQTILAKTSTDGSTNAGYDIVIESTEIKGNVADGTNQIRKKTSTVVLNQYNMITMVYLAPNSLTLYLNGINDTITVAGLGNLGNISNSRKVYLGVENNRRWFNGSIDDVMIFNKSLTQAEVTQLYNMGVNDHTVYNPPVNVTNTFNNVFIPNDGLYNWGVKCYGLGNESNITNSSTWRIIIDKTTPIIYPTYNLLNNKTIIYNGTLVTQINFSDEREIYSINVTTGDNQNIFNISNYGQTYYALNISTNVSSLVSNNLSVEVCDAHTDNNLRDLKTTVENKGLVFTMNTKWLFLKDQYVGIYPKDSSLYSTPIAIKKSDRYQFSFSKSIAPSTETFIVESSDYIDIAKKQEYKCHLIIPDIDNGYWIDFENEEATKCSIKRLSDTSVEVTIEGLKSKTMEFNSIGPLNCANANYYFGNLNPYQTYDYYSLINTSRSFRLNITQDTTTMSSINATLYYNNNPYFAGAIPNFTSTLGTPSSLTTNSSNISFFWLVNVDGIDYNVTSGYQNVSEMFIGNCDKYKMETLDISFWDEENNSQIYLDATGTFNYIYNQAQRSYAMSLSVSNETQLCINPEYASYTGNYSIFYSAAIYPQRRFYELTPAYNNISQTIKLYALEDTKGLYARFQLFDCSGNSLENVLGTMEGTVGGSSVIIEKEYSDGTGIATFWANPDNDYVFTFIKEGYTTKTYSIRPSSGSTISISMCSSTPVINLSTDYGMNSNFYPTNDLLNGTYYNLSSKLNSSYWFITGCTWSISNGSTTFYTTSNFTDFVCSNQKTINTGLNTTIISKIVYNLNSSSDITIQKQYNVKYIYTGQFSLMNFFDDMTAFGMAGFNNTTRMLLALIITLGILAMVSYKMSINEPIALIGLTIILTWLFSYINWYYMPYSTIPSEVLKQYIIAILVSLAGGAYLLKDINQ